MHKTEQILSQAVTKPARLICKAQIFGANIPTQIWIEGTENKNDLITQFDRSILRYLETPETLTDYKSVAKNFSASLYQNSVL